MRPDDGFRVGSLFFVGGRVVEDFVFPDGKRPGIPVEFLEEATLVTRVAGPSGLLDFKEQDVPVTIDVPAPDLLRIPAGFSLEPKLVARPAPVVHEPGFE